VPATEAGDLPRPRRGDGGALQSRETRTDCGPALVKALSRHSQASDDRAEHGRGVSVVTYMWCCELVRVDVDVVMGRGWEAAEVS
jgi:hypothetical protein